MENELSKEMRLAVDLSRFVTYNFQFVSDRKGLKKNIPASIKLCNYKTLEFVFKETKKTTATEFVRSFAKENDLQINKLSAHNIPDDDGGRWVFVDAEICD